MSETIKIQSSADNFSYELDTMGIIVYWKQGSGKTTISLELAFENWAKRIYSNFDIYLNGKQINRPITSPRQIQKIRFSAEPGVIMIDEAGINANSKDTQSKDSRVLIEVLFLARKYNCSFIWISQRFESIDVNARILADLILEMHKIRRGKLHPLFMVSRKKQKWSKLELYNQHKIDTIKLMEFDNLTYNTLEKSRFENGTEIKIKRKKGRKKWEVWKIERVDITT